jgi:hypothetical protein
MFYDPLKDTRTGDEKTPKPPFRVGIIVNQIPMTDVDGNEFMMDELSITDLTDAGQLSDLRRFIEAEALEETSDGLNSGGPYVEFLIYPTGFRLASLDDVDDVV